MYLVEFENRLLVLLQWGWNYCHLESFGATHHRDSQVAGGTPVAGAAPREQCSLKRPRAIT